MDDREYTIQEWLNRQRVRRETADIKNTVAAFGQVLSDVRESVKGYFYKGRRLRRDGLKGLFEEVDAAVRDGMCVVRFRTDVREATRARPKSEAYESMYVVIDYEASYGELHEKVFRLHALRMFGTRKKITIESRPLDVAFRTHSATRLYERGVQVDQAIAMLGAALQEWMPLPALAEAVLEDEGLLRFAVPGPSSGLVMGRYDRHAAVPFGCRYVFDGTGSRSETVPASPFAPYLFCGHTFLGDAELTRGQADLRRCFVTWKEACGKAYDEVLEDLIWPYREIHPAGERTVENLHIEALQALVSDSRALQAMGNWNCGRDEAGSPDAVLVDDPGETAPDGAMSPSP